MIASTPSPRSTSTSRERRAAPPKLSDAGLLACVSGLAAAGIERTTWPDGSEFEIRSYLSEAEPPLALVTAVRAVVRRDGRVLVFEDATGGHALPGGRLEPGESLLDGLSRELREEIGCEIAATPVGIGFVWLHHMGARPDGYGYPHPDLVHVVYVVTTASDPIERAGEEYVRAPRFVPLEEALALPILQIERVFLTHPLPGWAGDAVTD